MGKALRDTEFAPNTGYGIRIRNTGCNLAPKRRTQSRYRIQMQNTEHRMGPNPTDTGYRIRDTGYGYGIRDTGYGYGIRSLPHSARSSWYGIRDAEYGMQSPPHTHTISKMQDTDARYGIRSSPHTCPKPPMQKRDTDTGYGFDPTPAGCGSRAMQDTMYRVRFRPQIQGFDTELGHFMQSHTIRSVS